MPFTPTQEGIARITSLLLGGASSDNAVHRQIQSEIVSLSENVPEYPCYLALILSGQIAMSKAHNASAMRSLAGYALKNYLSNYEAKIIPEAMDFVKEALLVTLADTDESVAKVLGNVLSFLVLRLGSLAWPDPWYRISSLLQNESNPQFKLVLKSALLLCQDNSESLGNENATNIRDTFLEQIVAVVANSQIDENVSLGIRCYSEFILSHAASYPQSFSRFLPAVLSRAMSPSADLRSAVCICLVRILESNPIQLAQHINETIQYLLFCTKDADTALARESCEAWFVFADSAELRNALKNFLPELIPVLISRMVYTEDDLLDISVADAGLDVAKPKKLSSSKTVKEDTFYGTVSGMEAAPGQVAGVQKSSQANESGNDFSMQQQKGSQTLGIINNSGANNLNGTSIFGSNVPKNVLDTGLKTNASEIGDRNNREKSDVVNTEGKNKRESESSNNDDDDDIDEDDDDDDDDDNDDADINSSWTLRKCAAAALDVLSNTFANEITPLLLGPLKASLDPSLHWVSRESAILALGAVAHGCGYSLSTHLNDVLKPLINSLYDEHPLVRSITCWTFSRHCNWVVYGGGDELLEPMLKGFIANCVSKNRRVQNAACSALAELLEIAGIHIAVYLPQIVPCLASCFASFPKRNYRILYDCLGTLADVVVTELSTPEYVNMLLPALMQKWNSIDDTDKDILPLFECLSTLVVAFGPLFHPYIISVFERATCIIQKVYQETLNYRNKATDEAPEKDFLIVALDLVSGVVKSLGHLAPQFAAENGPKLLQALEMGMVDDESPVRQSALALLGDIAVNAFSILEPHAPGLVRHIEPHISIFNDPYHMRVCNNAIWACVEVVERMGQNATELIPSLTERILKVYFEPSQVRTFDMLGDNCMLAVGRFGNSAPAALAPFMARMAVAWCQRMIRIRESPEKESAVRGFLQALKYTPECVFNCIQIFCELLLGLIRVEQSTVNEIRIVLEGYKNAMGDSWQQLVSELRPHSRSQLHSRYNL